MQSTWCFDTPAKRRKTEASSSQKEKKALLPSEVLAPMCQPCVAVAPINLHRLHCRLLQRDCAQCYWGANASDIKAQLELELGSCPIVAASDIGLQQSKFAVGCITCRQYNGNATFGDFKVSTVAMLKANKLRRHIQSADHQAAMKRQESGECPQSSSGSRGQIVNPAVPTVKKFAFVIMNSLKQGSYRGWCKQVDTDDGDGSMERNISQRLCKQLLVSNAAAAERVSQDMLRNSHYLAIAIHDKDPTFILRVKGVTVEPVVDTFACVGAVLRDSSHSVEGI